ncbi:hypothetical protein [Paenibacillus sp. WC2504]|uniref:hypothetical protein n=1 Tax=Paenibacillus sp. WC2504 TaxID=3461403 RepID=UPI0040452B45
MDCIRRLKEKNEKINVKPDYTVDYFFSLLIINAQELKQELATGKSVVEIAASKNVSKQQLINVIANTQIEYKYKLKIK